MAVEQRPMQWVARKSRTFADCESQVQGRDASGHWTFALVTSSVLAWDEATDPRSSEGHQACVLLGESGRPLQRLPSCSS